MPDVQWSSRADAGLVEPDAVSREISPTAGVAGHWGGGGPFRFADHEDCLAEWAGWQAWHMSDQNSNDFVDIAYNLGACWHRYLLEGRSTRSDPIVRGGANGNRAVNGDRYSIVALWGSEDEGEPPSGLLITLRAGIDFLRDEAGAGDGLAPHRDLSSTACPGDELAAWLEEGAPIPAGAGGAGRVSVPVVIDLGAWSPRPVAVSLDGMALTVEFEAVQPEPEPKPEPEPEPKPEPPEEDVVPKRPSDGQFEPGTRHPSFTAMGERFLVWLDDDEIFHDGDGYQPGPTYTEYDDANIRAVQHKMGNAVDPVGKAYLGRLQWARVFDEGPPSGAGLPAELRGPTPPQLRDDPPPAQPSPPNKPPLPDPDDFQPGTNADWVTRMGERFLVWLGSDEIHKAGSVYTPGPRYSVYDDRNVRAVQAKMGNTVDPEGEEFLGTLQWDRLFTEGPPPGVSVPANLRPGGSSSSGGSGSAANIPVEGRRITQRFGVDDSRYAADEHTGVDFGDSGSDVVRSVGAGMVVYTGYDDDWGNRVIVRHPNGRYSWYCHLRKIDVSKGEAVSRGRRLGLMGSTGNTRGKHLHYQESTGGYGYWDYKRPTMLGFGGY